MEISEMLATIQEVASDVFDNDDLAIAQDTELSEVEGWDSFTKINLFRRSKRSSR